MRLIGTKAYGIRLPILKENDDLIQNVFDSVCNAVKHEGLEIKDKDIISITEALVARTQGNYATVDDIATDVHSKFGTDTIGVVFPILSRNRFSILLKGIAMGASKVIVQLSYPCDEVGNSFIKDEQLEDLNINPYTTHFDETSFRKTFGMDTKHYFTGVDYIEFYKSLSPNIEIIFSNDPSHILNYTKSVICADIHTRFKTKRQLLKHGAEKVYGLDEILTTSINGSGYHDEYGLLGSNKANETRVKLFPRDCQIIVDKLQAKFYESFQKKVEVMVYGDGAFKDPKGGIWELADPVTGVACTDGLKGTPNELKIKYLADNAFSHLTGDVLDEALRQSIREKDENLFANMLSEGTTPRQISDLVGSLSDLMSGSGDKGTPVILIQGYFDNYSTQ